MLKPSLQLKLTQQLTMTPQLQQAIRLLQLPIMELQTQIQTALDENVMLEVEEPENPSETTDATETTTSTDSDGDGGADGDGEVDMEMASASEPAEDFAEAAVAEVPTGKTRRRPARPKHRRAPSHRRRSSMPIAPRRRCAITCCGSSSSRISTREPRRSARPSSTRSTTTATSRTISIRSAPRWRRTCSRPSRKSSRCS